MKMAVFTAESFVDLFPKIVKSTLEEGNRTSPRRFLTLEVSPLLIQVQKPHQRFFGSTLINYPLTIMKQMQWVAGLVNLESLKRFDPDIVYLVDPLTGLYDGAYGPKVRPQLESLYRLFQEDPDSRRGVLSIFQISDQRHGLDVPTTLSLQFLLRGRELHMITYMRSNDIWGGLPTDVHLFGFLQEVMAAWLKVDLGSYTHIAGSGHIYKSSLGQVEQWLNSSHSLKPEPDPPMYKASFEDTMGEIEQLLTWEKSLARMEGAPMFFPKPLVDPYLRWCATKIAEHYNKENHYGLSIPH